jgi:hypothetical protein
MMRVRRRIVFAAAVALVVGAGVGIPLALLTSGGTGSTSTDPTPLNFHPVAGSFQPDDTALGSCEGDRGCLEQAFGNLAYHDGPKVALQTFRERIATDPDVEAGCHRIAHIIGSASLARYEGNVGQAFAAGDSTCWSGYYHGILERSFQGESTKEGVIAAAGRVCSDADLRQNLWLTYQCVHGLGHGLMIRSGYDLPFSLDTCETLATDWDRTSCTGGVFMENIAAGQTSAYGVESPWLRDDDPVYPCDAPVVEGRELYCYLMVTSRVLELNGYDFAATVKVCNGVEAEWIVTCFQSYGRDSDGYTRQNPKEVRRLCSLAASHERDCIYGAVRDMTSHFSDGTRAAGLCRSLQVDLRSICFNGVGTILGTISTDTAGRRRRCAAIKPGTYLADCLRGAGVTA